MKMEIDGRKLTKVEKKILMRQLPKNDNFTYLGRQRLKAAIKATTAESRAVKKEETKVFSVHTRGHLTRYRTHDLRTKARYLFLAYAFLRRKPYHHVERNGYGDVNVNEIVRIANQYGVVPTMRNGKGDWMGPEMTVALWATIPDDLPDPMKDVELRPIRELLYGVSCNQGTESGSQCTHGRTTTECDRTTETDPQ